MLFVQQRHNGAEHRSAGRGGRQRGRLPSYAPCKQPCRQQDEPDRRTALEPPCRLEWLEPFDIEHTQYRPQQARHEKEKRQNQHRLPRQRCQLAAQAGGCITHRPCRFARRQQASYRDKQEQYGRQAVSRGPAGDIGKPQQYPGRQHADTVKTNTKSVRQSQFALIQLFDGVTVNGDIVGGRQRGESADCKPHPRAEACFARAHDHHRAHADIGGGHPVTMPSRVIDQRRPQELERPR